MEDRCSTGEVMAAVDCGARISLGREKRFCLIEFIAMCCRYFQDDSISVWYSPLTLFELGAFNSLAS